MSYSTVVTLLRDQYGWPVGVGPAPQPVAVALQRYKPSEIASMLEQYCQSAGPAPFGYPGSSVEWARYRLFNDGVEYWDLNTGLALGQVVELPVEKIREALSVSEWLDNLSKNHDRLGFKAELTDVQREARAAKASQVPLEWSIAGAGLIYQLAVLSGTIQTGLTGFQVAYQSKSPSLQEVRGLDAQQWLDNLRCDDAKKPRKWLVGGQLNTAAK